jgi:ketosteroid isomerase-like protein
MSEENVEALKRAFAAAADQQPDSFFELLDEDVVWDVGDFPGGRFRGREGVREFFRQWVGTFENWNFEVRQMLDAGDSVFVHMHQRGRGKTSGAATEIDFWQVWLFLEGRVVRFVQKPDRRSALETAGLSE